ncbi:MAG: leucine-rich repeat domain-containing protein, partial [Fibrobacter sp.]|nr:leucine-rich repeat domain-containing protein [Fibrobacter sp.]
GGHPRTTYEIPTSVKTIGSEAFYGCTSLTEITIPGSVKCIGHSAFAECSALQMIYFSTSAGDGPRCIGEGAFYGCSSLMIVRIPYSVRYIGRKAFEFCPAEIDLRNRKAYKNAECTELYDGDLKDGQDTEIYLKKNDGRWY